MIELSTNTMNVATIEKQNVIQGAVAYKNVPYDITPLFFRDTVWRIAIYVRLSREDEKKYQDKKDSESIQNQIKFLKAWAQSFALGNEIKCVIYDIYIDDGYSRM